MSPPAKKTKLETSPGSPTIFVSPGQKPDIRLVVFDAEFHVSSSALKMNSMYFQRLLEPAGGAPPTSTSPLFKSEWYTVVDGDGTWSLSGVSAQNKNIEKFTGDKIHEQNAFRKILCVLYSRGYEIESIKELQTITTLADMFLALPILSNSLDASFYRTTGYITKISEDPCSMLVVAAQLRNKVLFRECFIHCLGPWNRPRYMTLKKDYEALWELAHKTRWEMEARISLLERKMLKQCAGMVTKYSIGAGYNAGQLLAADLVGLAQASADAGGEVMYPRYIKMLANLNLKPYVDTGTTTMIRSITAPLLKNNLVLDKSGDKVGEGKFQDCFLCFELADKDLPWDLDQVDF